MIQSCDEAALEEPLKRVVEARRGEDRIVGVDAVEHRRPAREVAGVGAPRRDRASKGAIDGPLAAHPEPVNDAALSRFTSGGWVDDLCRELLIMVS